MTELVLYHLDRQPIERVLPALIEKSLERGWRAVVQAGSEERLAAIDARLWTFRDDSFVPHGMAREADACEQPVLLTLEDENLNDAAVRFLLDGVPLPADATSYARIVLICDGEDAQALEKARVCLAEGRARGFAVTWWRPDAQGRWRKADEGAQTTNHG